MKGLCSFDQERSKYPSILPMAVVMLALAFALAACSSGGSSSPSDSDPDPNPTATAIPTAPSGLPPLEGAAAGTAGYAVALSTGMAPPTGPGGALVANVPEVIGGNIIDQDAAIRLGKAFFWDIQTGSDGQIACASCHFSAGADNRTTNAVHPGLDATFNLAGIIPGAVYTPATFDAQTLDDVIGSGGVISRLFEGISADLDDPVDVCTPHDPADPAQAVIAVAGERLVTGRNSPPAVGAVFYLDNFWDGRASHVFNGLTPLGDGAPVATIASLASQAVGPPTSDVEMSCADRPFNGPDSLGAKLVPRTPLAFQEVDPEDSVLGALSNFPETGLACGFDDRLCTYADLIAAAFGKPDGLSDEETFAFYIDNFSSIWGQAVQAYEATLVSNRTPYDLGTLTANQVAGLQEMRDRGCMLCHVEPEFSDATVRVITANGGPGVQKVVDGNLNGGDQGFHNIGASLTADDPGRAASPGGTYHDSVFNQGAFKTPGLRNLSLTAPYMHNGSIATIPDLIDFYNGQGQADTTPGFNPDAKVGLSGGLRDAAADFMLNGLLDCRVAHELAPFDHPSLTIPDGPALPAVGRTGDGTTCP